MLPASSFQHASIFSHIHILCPQIKSSEIKSNQASPPLPIQLFTSLLHVLNIKYHFPLNLPSFSRYCLSCPLYASHTFHLMSPTPYTFVTALINQIACKKNFPKSYDIIYIRLKKNTPFRYQIQRPTHPIHPSQRQYH